MVGINLQPKEKIHSSTPCPNDGEIEYLAPEVLILTLLARVSYLPFLKGLTTHIFNHEVLQSIIRFLFETFPISGNISLDS